MSAINTIQNAIRGDHQALRKLYNDNVETMMASSLRITNDMQASEDIIQESFLTSFNKLKTLSNKNNYQGWLRKIVINNSLSYLKKRQNHKEVNVNQMMDMDDNSEDNWYSDISFEKIRSAIQALPNSARVVFSLYALEGYKHKEIAAIQSISEATSKTQYRYARKLLRASLTKMTQDEI